MITVRNLHTGFCLYFANYADAQSFISAFDYLGDNFEILSTTTA